MLQHVEPGVRHVTARKLAGATDKPTAHPTPSLIRIPTSAKVSALFSPAGAGVLHVLLAFLVAPLARCETRLKYRSHVSVRDKKIVVSEVQSPTNHSPPWVHVSHP